MQYKSVTRSLAAAGVLLLASQAQAAFTSVRAPFQVGEDMHERIFEVVYGGNFTRSGVNFSSDRDVTARRIDDTLSNNGVFSLGRSRPGEAADQVIRDGFINADARVRFARDSQSFGVMEGFSGGTYRNLFDVVGSGYNVTGRATGIDLNGKVYRWGRNRGVGGIHSSLPSENPDNFDHLVSYEVQGVPNTPGQSVYMLFWEDRNFTTDPNVFNTDRDLNDLVVEIRALTAIPEPATAGLLAAGVIGLGCLSRRRRV